MYLSDKRVAFNLCCMSRPSRHHLGYRSIQDEDPRGYYIFWLY